MTSKPKRSRRIYYPAGIISLILLPTLCLWYLNRNHAFDKYGVIEVAWCSPPSNNPYIFSIDNLPNKNYTDINLTGNDKDDKLKFNYAQLQIRELVKSQDTSTGVHVHFSDYSKYWTLIRAFDICKIENAKIYINYENDMWILNPKSENPNEKKQKSFACGLSMDNVIVVKSDEQIELERKEFITDTAKTYFASGLLFIFMTWQTIKRLYSCAE
jgi:hypothetical protein